MAINAPERQRPYAATANVTGVLRRARARNIPERIDDDFLRVAGVSENVFGRVRAALRFLGLIEPDDRPTDLFRSMSAAPEAEYRELLEGAVREAYREDFARVNPSEDTQAQIVDQFAPYQPRSQTSRMVMLFLGLCRESGIPVSEPTRERAMRAGARPPGRTRSVLGSTRPLDDRKRPIVASGQYAGMVGLAGVTEADLANLDEATFTELWTVLGKAFYKSRLVVAERDAVKPEVVREDENG